MAQRQQQKHELPITMPMPMPMPAPMSMSMPRRGSRLHSIFLAMVFLLSAAAASVVEGAPILGPDLNSCKPVIPPRRTADEAVECCFTNTGRPIVDFKHNLSLPMRVRRAIHTLDEDYANKYKRAVALMRALPPDDPRSWTAQSKLHCSYCAAAYNQFNSSETFDVHHGWLLMPFHRWYVYFHERILASLIGDDTFAIPYWAWDVQNVSSPQPPNIMPPIFIDPSSPLHDPYRCHIHRPPHRVDLRIQVHPKNKEAAQQLRDNYYNMWRVMKAETKTPEAFFGGKFAHGYKVQSRAGRFETGPHAAVHGWTGDELAVFGEDMAPAYTAARDPLFFAHHSQVDRLWLMWNGFGGRNFDDPDWLDTEFLFYDENADMVRVNVRDCLDIEKLRVSYEEVPADWLEKHHLPRSFRERGRGAAVAATAGGRPGGEFLRKLWDGAGRMRAIGRRVSSLLSGGWGAAKDFSGSSSSSSSTSKNAILLGGTTRAIFTSSVARPRASERRAMITSRSTRSGSRSMESRASSSSSVSELESELQLEEVLVVSGIVRKPYDAKVLFNIFVELPEADEATPPDCAESLGDIYLEEEGRAAGALDSMVVKEFSHKIGIGERIDILGVGTAPELTFTFVPAWDSQHDADISVEFTELRLELHLV